MDFIVNRQPNPSPAIEYSEVYIPNKGNLGTGKFITRINPKSLLTEKFLIANVLLIPYFQLSVNLNPATGEVPVLLGHADEISPLSRKVFLLPQTIDHNVSHDFTVKFQNWNIISFMMDTILLKEKQAGEIQKTTFDQKEPSTVISNVTRLEFFRQLILLLEKIMPDDWFNNLKNQGHPAFQRWAFCQRVIAQHGVIKFPEQETELPLFGRFLLDAQCLKLITDQQYLDKLIKQAKTKIFNYLAHTSRFDDIMLEISVTAWHLMKNHNAEILEISNYPDVKLDILGLTLPIYAECKNITVDNDEGTFPFRACSLPYQQLTGRLPTAYIPLNKLVTMASQRGVTIKGQLIRYLDPKRSFIKVNSCVHPT